MNRLFRKYEQSFRRLADLEQDDLPRSIRLFNIRLRLALDIEVNFNGRIRLTKSQTVRDTYGMIYQLLEVWNAYEALSHYVDETTSLVVPKVSKSRIYTQKTLTEVGSMTTLANLLLWLDSEYKNDGRFQRDFKQYVIRIVQHDLLTKTITTDASLVLEHLEGSKKISGIETLSLIYAERNLFYHNGETAKMGMNYANRQTLISNYKSTLTEHLLKVAIFSMEGQIQSALGS